MTIRIGTVCEGLTDHVIIGKILEVYIGINGENIQPSSDRSSLGGGWTNVHKWCAGYIEMEKPIFDYGLDKKFFDFILIHLDSDIYENIIGAYYKKKTGFNRTEHQDRYDLVLHTIIKWLNNQTKKIIFCIAVESIETWIYASIKPDIDCESFFDIQRRLANVAYPLIYEREAPLEIKSLKKNHEVYSRLSGLLNSDNISKCCAHFIDFVEQLRRISGP